MASVGLGLLPEGASRWCPTELARGGCPSRVPSAFTHSSPHTDAMGALVFPYSHPQGQTPPPPPPMTHTLSGTEAGPHGLVAGGLILGACGQGQGNKHGGDWLGQGEMRSPHAWLGQGLPHSPVRPEARTPGFLVRETGCQSHSDEGAARGNRVPFAHCRVYMDLIACHSHPSDSTLCVSLLLHADLGHERR